MRAELLRKPFCAKCNGDGVEPLERAGKLERLKVKPPALWYKVVYLVFGYSALLSGLYLLVAGIIYSASIQLH